MDTHLPSSVSSMFSSQGSTACSTLEGIYRAWPDTLRLHTSPILFAEHVVKPGQHCTQHTRVRIQDVVRGEGPRSCEDDGCVYSLVSSWWGLHFSWLGEEACQRLQACRGLGNQGKGCMELQDREPAVDVDGGGTRFACALRVCEFGLGPLIAGPAAVHAPSLFRM